MQTDHGLSARRADRVLDLSRSARHYQPRARDDGPLIEAIEAGLQVNPGYGFGLPFGEFLRPKGWGKTRCRRVYVGLGKNLKRRGKQRLPERVRDPLEIPPHANHTWSADFMADALWSGRRLRTFNVTSLAEMRRMTEDWRHRYNHHRPHSALGGLPPVRYAMAQSPSTSTFV